MTVREQWNAMLNRIGLTPNAENQVSENELEKLNQALEVSSEPPVIETLPEQIVTATKTTPLEDPSPTEAVRSVNQMAYENDLRNFR